jgi:hypothetical protein
MIEIFKNRKLIIATKHEKESVIAPILTKELLVECYVPNNFDTDVLGTFSGEIERKLDPLSTVRQKCLMAMDTYNCDLGIASEGSFGAHPKVYFAIADDEILIFIDKKNNLEIIVREISTSTNFNGKTINNERDLLEFAYKVNFPTHGLILRKDSAANDDIVKGIRDKDALIKAYHQLFEKYGTVYAETDMRAMHNPTRMAIIEIAAIKLVKKLKSCCPVCKTPGFDVTDYREGLECSLCSMPTKSVKSLIYSCLKCNYIKEELYPNNKTSEDPMFCDFCNP